MYRKFLTPLLALSLSSSYLTAQPYWIWSGPVGQDQEVVHFRKVFQAKKGSPAKLYASCDNEMTIFVNGQQVTSSKSWETPQVVDISKHLIDGDNLIAVRGKNQGKGSAGLLVKLELGKGDSKTIIGSDKTWKASAKGALNWNTQAKANLSTWPDAFQVAKLGEGPWAKSINEKTLEAYANLKEPEATAPGSIKLKEGFKAELLYTVPLATQGSWVASTFDNKGRLIVSDQYGKLYRVSVPALGAPASDTKIEEIPVDLGEAQGLLWAFDSLYVITNSSKYPRGLWRVSDTNNDDVLDKVEMLRAFPNQGGEHGPHAVVLSPDGKSLYCVIGNQTPLTEIDSSRVPLNWGEDNLLPPLVGRGFMREVKAPGGWIAKTDPEGKTWELIASGFRNQYDAAFNTLGDLFTYDADMEWDFSTPWYRPTRVNHVLSGGEFGWRALSKKFPARWEDNLYPTSDVGPGSPTGVTFGYGAKFPAKYQNAFFISDWSYGKLYAIHLTPEGASYKAEVEEFMSANPLPLTDLNINPKDGAMYFMIGGRRVQSGLYRLVYNGKESTAPTELKLEGAAKELHALRKSLEAFHGVQDAAAIDKALANLGHADRTIRYSARIALEHQPIAQWKDRALKEPNPAIATRALMALIRSAKDDKSLFNPVLDALHRFDFAKLNEEERQALIRTYLIAFSRHGQPDESHLKSTLAKLAPLFPTKDAGLDVDLGELLTFLGDPSFLPHAITLVESAPTQEEQIAHAQNLRFAKAGWTKELRERYFKWVCLRAPAYKGGASFPMFMDDIKKDAIAGLSEAEKAELKPILEAKPNVDIPQFTFTPKSFVKNYSVEDLASLLNVGLEGGRNFDNGRNMFGQTTCFVCHRFGSEGGAIGPDLSSVAGKYSPRDLLTHIIEPNKEISDQYGQIEVTMVDGSKVYGRIMNLSGENISLNINMMDPNALQSINRKLIKSMTESKISMMPPGLLNTLSEDDILDLLAYLLSKGNRKDPMFEH